MSRRPTTGKARKTVGASRTERSAVRQVGDIVVWTQVLRRKSVQDLVHQNGNLVLNSLRHGTGGEQMGVID